MMDASALQSLPPRWLTFSQISPILPQFGEWTSQTCHKQDGSEVEEQNLDFQRPHPKILNPAQGRKEKTSRHLLTMKCFSIIFTNS